MKIADRSRTGISRYCPTFSDAFSRPFRKAKEAVDPDPILPGQAYRKGEVRERLAKGETSQLREMVARHPESTRIIAGLLSDADWHVRKNAACALLDTLGSDDASVNFPRWLSDLPRDATPLEMVFCYLEHFHHGIIVALPALKDTLSDKDPRILLRTLAALKHTAQRWDVSALMPVVAKAFSEADSDIRDDMSAADWVHAYSSYKYDYSIAVPELAELFDSREWRINCYAANALGDAAAHGCDISVAVPALAGEISCFGTRAECAADALRTASKTTDINISDTIPRIIDQIWYEYGKYFFDYPDDADHRLFLCNRLVGALENLIRFHTSDIENMYPILRVLTYLSDSERVESDLNKATFARVVLTKEQARYVLGLAEQTYTKSGTAT